MAPARAGLPDLRTRPSRPSVSTHLRMLRLVRARYPSTDRTEIASPRVFSQRELGASSFVSRLAASHRPYRVPYRTDEQFTSCCSPPRVATTQLQADYKLRCLEEDSHLSDRMRSQAHWHGRPARVRSWPGRPCHAPGRWIAASLLVGAPHGVPWRRPCRREGHARGAPLRRNPVQRGLSVAGRGREVVSPQLSVLS